MSWLSLDNNQLDGSIPSELGSLSNLEYLALVNNQLSGSIPPKLGNLSNLTFLFLNNNRLVGNIPSEIGRLSTLVWFNLSNNQLSGSIPPELGSLFRLANDGGLNICGNLLTTTDDVLHEFLNSKQKGGNWEKCQLSDSSSENSRDNNDN